MRCVSVPHGGNRFSGSLVTILFSLLAGFKLLVDGFRPDPVLFDELFELLGIDCARLRNTSTFSRNAINVGIN